jgi:hypothetical protein
MSFATAITAANIGLFANFGETVTYIPAGGGASFACSAVVDRVEVDGVDSKILRDLCEVQIRHTSLSANSIDEPTPYRERQTGDQVVILDQAGASVSWKVIDAIHDHGIWILTLEKNIRIVP